MRPALVALLALAAGAVGGVVSTHLVTEAHADPGAIVVPVPDQGVAFRGPQGRVVARVRAEPAGGVIEVLDAREQVAVRLRATGGGGVIDLGTARPLAQPASTVVPVWPTARAPNDPGY